MHHNVTKVAPNTLKNKRFMLQNNVDLVGFMVGGKEGRNLNFTGGSEFFPLFWHFWSCEKFLHQNEVTMDNAVERTRSGTLLNRLVVNLGAKSGCHGNDNSHEIVKENSQHFFLLLQFVISTHNLLSTCLTL